MAAASADQAGQVTEELASREGGPAQGQAVREAAFIEDVDAFMAEGSMGKTADEAMRACDEMYQQYKMLEENLSHRRKRVQGRLPDITATLQAIRQLQKSRAQTEGGDPVITDFKLAEGVYAKGRISSVDTVCLWLGANVMLEYKLEEAETLLSENEGAAKETITRLGKNLDWLRDQSTTMEVNMARIFNWDVKERRTKAEQDP